jgi:hypothetical protein
MLARSILSMQIASSTQAMVRQSLYSRQAPGSSCKGWSEKVAFSERKLAISLFRKRLFEVKNLAARFLQSGFSSKLRGENFACPNWDLVGAVSRQLLENRSDDNRQSALYIPSAPPENFEFSGFFFEKKYT